MVIKRPIHIHSICCYPSIAFSWLPIHVDRVILDLKGTLIHMPEISLFYGIRVTMHYDDHMPPYCAVFT